MNGFAITGVAAGSSPSSVATLSQAIPIGSVIDFAGATAPAGWALCYGQAVNRTTYADLFESIGTTYGAGNGSTTFNLPDCRGRVTAGKDNMGGSAAGRISAGVSGMDGTVSGATGGEQVHTLSTSEIPAHTHTGTTGAMASNQVHQHTFDRPGTPTAVNAGADKLVFLYEDTLRNTGAVNVDHLHNFITNHTGGGAYHNNIQPTLILNKIIRVSYDG